jgi:DNA-binding transcriptional regulator YdaS (Cro superfamily)
MDKALKRAIELAGGPVKFAAALDINRQAVWTWTKCPTHRVFAVEALTGVSREELRPDLFRVARPVALDDANSPRKPKKKKPR